MFSIQGKQVLSFKATGHYPLCRYPIVKMESRDSSQLPPQHIFLLCIALHNAYIEQLKFLPLVCAWTGLKICKNLHERTDSWDGNREKFNFCEPHTLNFQISSKMGTVLYTEPSKVAQ